MSNNKTNLKLESLYQEEKYKETVDLAFELLETEMDPVERFKIGVYIPKSFIQLVSSPEDESGIKLFKDSVGMAAGMAESIEDIWFLFEELKNAYHDWNSRCIENAMMILIAEQQGDFLKEYLKSSVEYIKISMVYEAMIANSEVAKKYQNEKGLTNDEWWAEVKSKTSLHSGYLSSVEYMDLHYQTALTIFSDIKARVTNYSTDDTEKAQAYTKKLCTNYIVAFILADSKCVNPEKQNLEDVTDEEKRASIKCLKLSAEIEKDLFEAKVKFKGKPLSVFRGDRENQLLSLKKKYNNIKILEPDFIIPELPSVEFVNFPKNGCYVATAVYGSYDCPQVWTLRRYRDYTLAQTWYGRAFIRMYYAVSPTIVNFFGNTVWFNKIWRKNLDKKVKKLQKRGFESTPYKD